MDVVLAFSQKVVVLDWRWVFILPVIVFAMVLPLFFRKWRMRYLTVWGTVVFLAVLLAWVWDRHAHHDFGATVIHVGTTRWNSWGGGITSVGSSMGVRFTRQSQDLQQEAESRAEIEKKLKFSGKSIAIQPPSSRVQLTWLEDQSSATNDVRLLAKLEGGPVGYHIHYKGFGMSAVRLPARAGGDGFQVRVLLPNWVICLGMAPLLVWCYQRQRSGLRLYRRDHNLCEHCGYMLNGLPQPVRCPECGVSPKPVLAPQ